MTLRPDSRLGTDLGPYRIEALLGRGGMGVVYLAEQLELGRKVALKLLPDELAADADFRARFERESRLAAAIDHPNIIPIYEAGEIDGVVFIAMRYVEGTDLATRLQQEPLAPDQAWHILSQVAKALDAAHARGLVHRDVKPANVLLDAGAGEGGDHAYLTDFGLTKQAGSESGLTKAGAFLGTLAYMAPEQIDGREVDGRADEYSLAAMAFEALTGQVPFRRDQEIAVAMAHLKDPVPSAVALRPELPAGVDAVLARGLAKDRDARYPDCGAFVAELREALGGRAASPPGSSGPHRRRTPVLVGLAGLGIVAVVGAGFVLGGPSSPGPSPSPSGALAAVAPPTPTVGPTPTSTAFPNTQEADLIARLPASIAASCVRGSYDPVEGSIGDPRYLTPLASVRCDLPIGTGATTAWFQLFPETGGGGSSEFSVAQAALNSLERAKKPPQPNGDCRVQPGVVGSWSSGGVPYGLVVCYRGGGASWIYWSYDSTFMLAHATRSDLDWQALATWWNAIASFVRTGQ